MAQTSFSTLSADAATYIRDELLDIAERNVVFAQHALMADLPQHNSKTCQFSRYPRLDLPLAPAVEGQTPASVALSVETVQAVVDQWILIVEMTDLAQITIKHPIVPITTERLGLAEAELVDREIQKVLLASASVSFAGGTATVRSDLDAVTTESMTSTTIRSVWSLLSRNGARQFGRNYALIVDPEVSQDVASQPQFLNIHQLVDIKAVQNNVIGSFLGFDIEVSNFIPKITLGNSADFTVAINGSDGTFGNGNTVWVRLEALNSSTGLVEKVYDAKSTVATTSSGVNVTVPVTTGFVYNVYMGSGTVNSIATSQLVNAAVAAGAAAIHYTAYPAVSSTALRPQQPPSGSNVVHTSYAIGKDAFGMVKLSGDNLRVLMTDGKPTDSDPAAQRRKISLKGSFKCVELNANFHRRIESLANF